MLPAALERISAHASSAKIRSFGLHTLLSKRNRGEARRAGLTYTVHGPFGYTGIWDLDEAERLKALDEHRRHLEASAEIGALLYVVHPDWHPEAGPRDPAIVAQLDRSFETLRGWQDELGVEIVVENLPGAGMSHFTHPGDLDLRGLGLILDADTPASAAAWTRGSLTRGRPCATCTCTTTTARATPTTRTWGSAPASWTRRPCWPPRGPPAPQPSSSTIKTTPCSISLARLRELGLL